MRRVSRRRGLGTALAIAGAVAIGLSLLAWATGALSASEHASVDARFSVRGTQPAPRDVAVVGIDANTLARLNTPFPFSRELDARMIRRLLADGARVIAYDVVFDQRSDDARADQDLGQAAVDAHGRVVLADDAPDVDHPGRTDVFGGTTFPGEHVGNSRVDADPAAVIRRFRYSTTGLRDFAVVAAATAGHPVSPSAFGAHGAWIDYRGPKGTVPTYSFVQVLDGADARALRGKVVVVGGTEPSLLDVHPTPTSPAMPGPEIQATKIDTILRGLPLRSTSGVLTFVLIVLLGMVAPLVAWRFGALWAALAALAAGALFAVGAQVAFDHGHIVTVSPPLLALILGTIAAVVITATYAALERERTRTLFARFVPAAVVDQVLAQTDGGVRLGGVLAEVTVLFCDLRGSTPLVEAVGASRGIEVLNRYLTAMTEAILAHGGTLAGFRGDGLMAVFGAPLEQPDHARRAVDSAREMAGPKLDEVNAWVRTAEIGPDLQIGVGVCSGVVMAGNVGSEERMEFTVVGVTANIAARLEAMTKGTPHRIYIADSTHALLGTAVSDLAEVGDLDVRGARAPVKVWAPAP
jgi:adenylate cyclase